MKLLLFTDGGARGNPWPAGAWVVIYTAHKKPLEKRYKYLWVCTNNQAEYTAAHLAIARAIELGGTEIELFMDSELIVNQLKGTFRVKNQELKVIFDEIRKLLGSWKWRLEITHIPREKNREADRLSNKAMDEGEKQIS